MRTISIHRLLAIATLAALPGFAQLDDRSTERKTYSGVRELVLDNVSGFIEVTAGTGAEVEVEVTRSFRARSEDRLAIARKELKLEIRQEGGLLQYMVDGPFRCHCSDNSINFNGRQLYDFSYDFKVKVPRAIALELRAVNNSHIKVQGTAGDFKINNVNGPIEMTEIEGKGSVHTVNGGVKVTFARNPTGPVSFKSVNGKLDVAFRSGLNADLKMKTFNGGMYTDFDATSLPQQSLTERVNGRFVYKRDRAALVRVGSGGPELNFETLNGDVLVKNREK